MNRHLALALSALFVAAAPAFADDITMEPHPFISTATRAEVLADLHQFRQSGVNPWADDYNQIGQGGSALTREEVTAQYMGSRDMVSAFTGEDSGSNYLILIAAAQTPVPGTAIAQAE
jgi:hypothetical protein